MTTTWVSILLPVFNTNRSYLLECYQSIVQQRWPYLELVVVNDGSTAPETLRTLEEIQQDHPNVQMIHLPENLGISAALNAGLEACTHEWIARMDADDIMLPEKIETQIQYLKEHPEVILLGTWERNFGSNGQPVNQAIKQHPAVVDAAFVIDQPDYYVLNHPTVMFRKSFVQSIGGYDESLQGYPEDYELWLRCLSNGAVIHNLQQVLMLYRKDNAEKLTHHFKPDVKQYCERIKAEFTRQHTIPAEWKST